MQLKELRRLSDEDLGKELTSAKEELFNLRFQLATRQLKNVRQLPAARRKIAQVLTVTRERELTKSA